MKFLKVYTDVGKNKPVILFAKVVREHDKKYDVRYFSPFEKQPNGQTIFNYESVVYTVDNESVVDCIYGDDERVIGYEKTPHGWVRLDENDPEYEPSEDETCSDETTSLEDELSGDDSDVQDEDEWIDDDDE